MVETVEFMNCDKKDSSSSPSSHLSFPSAGHGGGWTSVRDFDAMWHDEKFCGEDSQAMD